MPTGTELIDVSLALPKSLVDRVSDLASEGNRTLEEEIATLLSQSLRSKERLRDALQRVRAGYDAELAATGRPRPTTEELWQQMNRIREEVANELYPD